MLAFMLISNCPHDRRKHSMRKIFPRNFSWAQRLIAIGWGQETSSYVLLRLSFPLTTPQMNVFLVTIFLEGNLNVTRDGRGITRDRIVLAISAFEFSCVLSKRIIYDLWSLTTFTTSNSVLSRASKVQLCAADILDNYCSVLICYL